MTLVNIGRKLDKNMFIAKVVGQSMEPLIPNNSYCVFRANVTGSRQGKVVLVEHQEIGNIESHSICVVKKYRSEKHYNEDGTWAHERIILESLNKEYNPIILSNRPENEFKVIAEFAAVIH